MMQSSVSLEKILLVTLFLLVAFKTPSASEIKVEIVCESVYIATYAIVGRLVECNVDTTIVTAVPDTVVSNIKPNDNFKLTQIEALWVEHARSMKFIPAGIKNKLPNLKALFLKNNGILIVGKTNLREFGDSLGNLDLAGNQLAFLDGDLFEYNNNLRDVSFYNNPIQEIDSSFFYNLKSKKKLEFVNLKNIGCMSQEVFFTDIDISTYKWKNEKCIDENARVESHLRPIIDRMSILEEKVEKLSQILDCLL